MATRRDYFFKQKSYVNKMYSIGGNPWGNLEDIATMHTRSDFSTIINRGGIGVRTLRTLVKSKGDK